ncbi:hypothetical protein Scep_012380 [Stephania cephalantha]|uniref:Uncharacterized protein n=1 Tax=Stephania cephalantha TaxID=152367 RepID=A0AAP0JFG5_9MAGN
MDLPLHTPTLTLTRKILEWSFNRIEVLNSFTRSDQKIIVCPSVVADSNFKLVMHLLHKILHKVLLAQGGSKNYVTLLDMYVLGALIREILISLLLIIIAHMTSTSGSGRHLPYAQIMTSLFEAVQQDLRLGGRPLLITDTIGMATLKVMKYYYIHMDWC